MERENNNSFTIEKKCPGAIEMGGDGDKSCSLFKQEGKVLKQSTGDLMESRVEVLQLLQERAEIHWTVPMSKLICSSRFSKICFDEEGESLERSSEMGDMKIFVPSPQYLVGCSIGAPTFWSLQLDPRYKEDNAYHISLYLWLRQYLRVEEQKNPTTFVVDFEIQIINEGGAVAICRRSSLREFGPMNGYCYGWKKFCSYESLKKVSYPLHIRVKMILFKPTVPNDTRLECDQGDSVVSNCIKSWISSLWKSRWGWDAVICVKNKTSFRVHTGILKGGVSFLPEKFALKQKHASITSKVYQHRFSRSYYFDHFINAQQCLPPEHKDLLQPSCQHTKFYYNIPDLETRIVELVLKFCYQGCDNTMFVDLNTACKMLEAAYQLGVLMLQRQCLIQIISNFISIETYVKIALMEFKYGFLRFHSPQLLIQNFLLKNMKKLKQKDDGLFLRMYSKNDRMLAWHLFGR